jgi:DNA-binding MarR family transcriptional regulator
VPPDPATRRRPSLLLQVFAAYQRMGELVERELARDGVVTDGYAVLSAIGAFGPLTLTELAAMLGLPLTTASDVVRRLEARGRITRRPHPDDGRSHLLELTPAGDSEWRAGWPALQRIDAALVERLGDPTPIRDSLERLDEALAETLEEGSPKS